MLWYLKRRFLKKLDLAFPKHNDDASAFAGIEKRLDALNQDSAHFVFTMERYTEIRFRQRDISVLYGRIGT